MISRFSNVRKLQIIVLLMGIMLMAVTPSFAQVSIDIESITTAFQDGLNSIFDYMILFLPFAGVVIGLTVGLPLAFKMMQFLGKLVGRMFGGGAA